MTYILLDEHAQAWLHLILYACLPIFSIDIGGKQRGRLSNTWLDSGC